MIYLFIVVHIVVCLFLIGVILLQQGKSADLAGAFGGQGSQTAFGPRSAANLLTRITTWCAIVFMITSIGLTILINICRCNKSLVTTIGETYIPVKRYRSWC